MPLRHPPTPVRILPTPSPQEADDDGNDDHPLTEGGSPPSSPKAVRGAVNEVISGVLYQRGQILTWPRERKYDLLRTLGVRTVVNFWPKADPDMAESPATTYLLASAVRSEMMTERRMDVLAGCVVELMRESPVLVLCEAGKTRSVYFCVLLVSGYRGLSLPEARDVVLGRIRSTSLKPFMHRRIESGARG